MNREGKFYTISVERTSIDPNSTYINYEGAERSLEKQLKKVNHGIKYDMFGPLGYDDLTIEIRTENKFEAIMVAAGLDSILDKASESYIEDYQVKHNASVSGPWEYEIDQDGYAELVQADGWNVIY